MSEAGEARRADRIAAAPARETEGIRADANPWDERAEAYRTSEAHRHGADLDLLVEWAAGAKSALDVGSGGGHVARRLREAGLEVVTVDPAPGMQADVVAAAEDLPFPDASFEVVACRAAVHHFADVPAGVRELARVAADRVLVVDNLFMGEAAEEAERLRDPSHVRNLTEAEWRSLLEGAGLRVEEARTLVHEIDVDQWLHRTDCADEVAERVRALLADRIESGKLGLDRIALRAGKEA
jgi:SAM-dependent methyltransferase